jgi:hypothetical protein
VANLRRIAHSTIRPLKRRDYQLNKDMSEVARDINRLG